jgi:hypothetical protein
MSQMGLETATQVLGTTLDGARLKFSTTGIGLYL